MTYGLTRIMRSKDLDKLALFVIKRVMVRHPDLDDSSYIYVRQLEGYHLQRFLPLEKDIKPKFQDLYKKFVKDRWQPRNLLRHLRNFPGSVPYSLRKAIKEAVDDPLFQSRLSGITPAQKKEEVKSKSEDKEGKTAFKPAKVIERRPAIRPEWGG